MALNPYPLASTDNPPAVLRLKRGITRAATADGPAVSLIPVTVIDEDHHDDLVITGHPVQQGAAITDHAYKKPAEIVVQAGWTNSSDAAGDDETYVRGIYTQLLALQLDRNPFEVWTAKRLYDNMLMQGISTTTSTKTENALIVTLRCKEVILVNTQVLTLAPAQQMAAPQITAAPANTGSAQLAPAPKANTPAIAKIPSQTQDWSTDTSIMAY